MDEQQPRPTIDEFLAAHPCTLTSERASLTPSKKGDVFSFLVTIAREKRVVTVPYTMGIGCAKDPRKVGNQRYMYRDAKQDPDGFWWGGIPYHKTVIWPDVELRSVIDCLRCDASFVLYAPTFAEFCAESGYTSIFDHDTARKSYDGCHESLAKLRTLFGFDGANTLVNDVEGL